MPMTSLGTAHGEDLSRGQSMLAGLRHSQVSAWTVVLLGICGLGAAISSYANVDSDIYWHRILGEIWIEQRGFNLDPDPIAFTAGSRDWFPTAWLPEVGYAALVEGWGYGGILALRFVLVVAFFGLLARYLLSHAPAWLAAICAAVVGLPAALVLQDRPQTMSLVICAAALPVLHRWLLEGRLPGIAASLIWTWSWANVHGLWVLVPMIFVLASVADALDRSPTWRHHMLTGALCVGAAASTPVGPRLLLAPVRIGTSAGALTEWQATAFRSPVAWGFGLSLILLIIVFAALSSVPSRHLVAALAFTVFGLSAYRNAVPASLLLLPLVVTGLCNLTQSVRTDIRFPRTLVIAATGASLVALGWLYSQNSVIPENSPKKIAAELRQLGSVHVLAPYNNAGYLREFGGARVRVAIDGRADRYGGRAIREHLALMEARGRWRASLRKLDPDVVVVDTRLPLRDFLVDEGWKVSRRDGRFALLTRP